MEKISDDVSKKELRSFGCVLGLAFVALGVYAAWLNKSWWEYAISLGALLVLSAAIAPSLLRYPRRIWMRIGEIMGSIMTRAILFLLFIFAITPLAIVLRLSGKDLLSLKLDKEAKTYWLYRKRGEREKDHWEKQF